jgi:hypothetical protein
MKLTEPETNTFAKLLFDKPAPQRNDSIIKRIKLWFKRKNYEYTSIKPMINKLRNTAPSFITMCEIADFIKILEKVFFYKNDIRKSTDTTPLETRLLADNKIDSIDKKAIILEMQKEMITISFIMTRDYNATTEKYDDIIKVSLYYDFGRKLHIEYKIVNTKIEFDSVYDYNLMYNINILLQDAIADLFEKYYKLV